MPLKVIIDGCIFPPFSWDRYPNGSSILLTYISFVESTMEQPTMT